jgi:hypothetical protein
MARRALLQGLALSGDILRETRECIELSKDADDRLAL